MFVRWECGCKGFIAGGDCFVIYVCDGESPELGMFKRDMENYSRGVRSPKTFSELDTEERDSLIERVASLISDGYRHRMIKQLYSI